MKNRRLFALVSIGATMAIGASAVHAENAPQFRGINSDGRTEEKNLPQSWSETENVAWKVSIPGEGWSCPIVWGDRVIVTTAVEDESAKAARMEKEKAEQAEEGGNDDASDQQGRSGRRGRGRRGGRDNGPPDTIYHWQVHCMNAADGKELWKTEVHKGRPPIPKHGDNTYASETPVTDGERIYAYFGMVGVFCLDMDGKLLWKKDLGSYPMQAGFGTASGPALHDGLLFLQIDNEEKSFVVALDAKTGDEKWRDDRDEKTNWSSPIVWKNSKRAELIVGGQKTRSYNPADGKELWMLDMGGGRTSASPTPYKDYLFFGTESRRGGGGGALVAIKAGADGDITPKDGETTSDGVAWMQPDVWPAASSPVVCNDHVYLLQRRGGIMNCFNVETGKAPYDKQRIPEASAFWASPWANNEFVYCPDDQGTTHVLRAGPTFEVTGTNKLDGRFWATPALANGAIYLRSADQLYCIRK